MSKAAAHGHGSGDESEHHGEKCVREEVLSPW